MDNYQIADQFSLLSKLMDIHGENSFKSKSYSITAFTIEKLPVQLIETEPAQLASIKGIGASSAQKITELLETGQLEILNKIILATPPGVLEMLNIKGLGPKKINTIWKEMEIESLGELLYACKENRLKLYKGFGEKTQQSIIDVIEFYNKNKGSRLYAHAEIIVAEEQALLHKIFPEARIEITGAIKRHLETIDTLEFLLDVSIADMQSSLEKESSIQITEVNDSCVYAKGISGVTMQLYPSSPADFGSRMLALSSAPAFMESLNTFSPISASYIEETGVFEAAGLPYIPAHLRDSPLAIQKAQAGEMDSIIEPADIRGIIHCHTTWSDGSHTVAEMANAAIERGLEYIVISDHSKTAFYAQGLSEDRVKQQHQEIDSLNEKLKPFRIFKSIESDILNDGSLDYSDQVLATFDLVIASVHSNLKMTSEKSMMRLLHAIRNPYTNILGHMTGRLLLSRAGYPVDHKSIIDACAEHNVVIELNAHPNRLDMDWREIEYALEKNVLISIDPDSHHTGGLDDTRYGVISAQKAWMRKEKNLSSFPLPTFESFIRQQHAKRP